MAFLIRRPERSVKHSWMLRTRRGASIILALLSCLAAQSQTHIYDHKHGDTRLQLLQFVGSGQLQDAISLGEKAVSQWPQDPEIHHYLGLAYFKTGQLKPAREQLERARDLNKRETGARFDLALVCLSQQDYSAAADELQVVVKLTPSNPLAHVLLGRSYLNSNRSVPAIDEFKTALRLDPSIRLGHYHLGFAYSSLGRNDEAIAEYRTEVQRSGEHPEVVYELGHSLLEAGKHEEAVGYLQRASELTPQNPDVWYNLGKAQVLAGRAVQGEASLRKAIELNPQDPRPHYQLARALETLGKSEEARVERERFAELKKAQPAAAGTATGRDQ